MLSCFSPLTQQIAVGQHFDHRHRDVFGKHMLLLALSPLPSKCALPTSPAHVRARRLFRATGKPGDRSVWCCRCAAVLLDFLLAEVVFVDC